MTQHYYTLQINAISASFDIKINDIPLYIDSDGKPTAVELPINHLLISGKNVLQVVISHATHETEFVDHTRTDFEIYSRDVNNFSEQRTFVESAEFPDFHNDESLKTSVLSSTKYFQASLMFEEPVWSTSPALKLNEQTISEALEVYRVYFNALKSQNIDTINKLTSIKNKRYANALYQNLSSHITEMQESHIEEFTDSSNVLIDFDVQVKKPELHAFGKLLRIINDDNRSPLEYFNTETGDTTEFEIYLCMLNKKLTIVL